MLRFICFTFLLVCASTRVLAAHAGDGVHFSSASADDVIRLDTAIEPTICELLSLEKQLMDEIRSSGIDVKELMARDANDDTPAVRGIRRISSRVQEIQVSIEPTTSKLEQMIKQLSAAERSKVDSHRRGTLDRCPRP